MFLSKFCIRSLLILLDDGIVELVDLGFSLTTIELIPPKRFDDVFYIICFLFWHFGAWFDDNFITCNTVIQLVMD